MPDYEFITLHQLVGELPMNSTIVEFLFGKPASERDAITGCRGWSL